MLIDEHIQSKAGVAVGDKSALPMLYSTSEGEPRHMDMMWPLWNLFDATPEGRGGDWHPPLNP
jgi:predicted dithiol-disulfide oxidoreductase (DUF899 family)